VADRTPTGETGDGDVVADEQQVCSLDTAFEVLAHPHRRVVLRECKRADDSHGRFWPPRAPLSAAGTPVLRRFGQL
jgi:hypothetical protein